MVVRREFLWGAGRGHYGHNKCFVEGKLCIDAQALTFQKGVNANTRSKDLGNDRSCMYFPVKEPV
jgi:hypothetical protein